MGERPSPKHTIGRIDNDGDYRPGNVEWQTYAQQSRNMRTNVFLTIDGRTQIRTDWAAERGISGSTIRYRMRRGLSEFNAVNMASHRGKLLRYRVAARDET